MIMLIILHWIAVICIILALLLNKPFQVINNSEIGF